MLLISDIEVFSNPESMRYRTVITSVKFFKGTVHSRLADHKPRELQQESLFTTVMSKMRSVH